MITYDNTPAAGDIAVMRISVFYLCRFRFRQPAVFSTALPIRSGNFAVAGISFAAKV
jgi:hypothetical protein